MARKITVQTLLDPEDLEQVQNMAAERGLSVSAMIRLLLKESIDG